MYYYCPFVRLLSLCRMNVDARTRLVQDIVWPPVPCRGHGRDGQIVLREERLRDSRKAFARKRSIGGEGAQRVQTKPINNDMAKHTWYYFLVQGGGGDGK